jgi:hypothetical protein
MSRQGLCWKHSAGQDFTQRCHEAELSAILLTLLVTYSLTSGGQRRCTVLRVSAKRDYACRNSFQSLFKSAQRKPRSSELLTTHASSTIFPNKAWLSSIIKSDSAFSYKNLLFHPAVALRWVSTAEILDALWSDFPRLPVLPSLPKPPSPSLPTDLETRLWVSLTPFLPFTHCPLCQSNWGSWSTPVSLRLVSCNQIWHSRFNSKAVFFSRRFGQGFG